MNLDKILPLIGYGIYGMVGGLLAQLLFFLKGNKLVRSYFFANIVLSMLVGLIVGQTLPVDRVARDSIIALCGISAYQIVEFVKNNGLQLLINFLQKKIK